MKTNQMKLLGGSAALVLFGAILIQGCSSSDDSSGLGTSSGGATGGKGGTSSTAGKGGTASGGGSSGTAGTSSSTAGTGGSSSGTAGTSAGGSSSAGDTGMTEGGASGAPGGNEGGAAGAMVGDGRDCTKFCADEATTCAGALSPYASTGACMSACEGFSLGGDPTTTTAGDTYACRRYHLSAAASPGPASTHCPHTGLISKNALTDTTATGPCK